MKIYHTETQADYDALMVELESRGVEWNPGVLPTRLNVLKFYKNPIGIMLHYDIIRHSSLDYYQIEYPTVPIIKYKAKAEDEMKFTKENVEAVIDEYFRQADFEPCGDLIAEIRNLDDTPEKVVVPKFVADYLEDCKKRNIKLVSALCPFKMGYGNEIELWFDSEDNNRLFALAWINGYEVEKEPLYCVNINGQYLVKMIPERNVHKFVEEVKLCVWDTQAYQLSESDIKEIDERYWPFAVLAND